MKRLIKWFKEGNDCGKCNCGWEERGWEDWDAGCYVNPSFDEKPCRKPLFWRRLLLRRAMYFRNHEHDGILEYYEESDRQDKKCRKALENMLGGAVICWKEDDGTLRECNTDGILTRGSWDIREALKPEWKKPPTIMQRWKTLLYDTFMIIPNKIKPFICK